MFIQRLLKHSKIAGLLFVLFCITHLFIAYRSVEAFPFLLYGMYSQPAKESEVLVTYDIRIDGLSIEPSTDLKEQMFFSPLQSHFSKADQSWGDYYQHKLGLAYIDKSTEFKHEYLIYLSDILSVEKQRISVFRISVSEKKGVIDEEQIIP